MLKLSPHLLNMASKDEAAATFRALVNGALTATTGATAAPGATPAVTGERNYKLIAALVIGLVAVGIGIYFWMKRGKVKSGKGDYNLTPATRGGGGGGNTSIGAMTAASGGGGGVSSGGKGR